MKNIPSLKRLRRIWVRNESPRRSVLQWSGPYKVGIIFACLIVALISSWDLLGEPNLRPGTIAPFDAIAPTKALVEDTKALQQKRSDLVPRTFVQVIDSERSQELLELLDEKLKVIKVLVKNNETNWIGPVNLSKKEKDWLKKNNELSNRVWAENIKDSASRMLSQGLVNTLANDQLELAASIQLEPIYKIESAANKIGSKLIRSTFSGTSNLKTDPVRSKRLIEELVTKQGIPTIKVNKGDLIARKGEAISSQAFDVLNHFGMISWQPRPVAWFWRFIETLASCIILLLIMRRERPCLQARHGLLAIGLLLVTQAGKVWFGAAVSPLAVIVPPTLLISQGFGTSSALAWMAVGSFLWPVPVSGIGEGRMLVACTAAAIAAFQGARMRSRAQLIQMAILLPFGALFSEWILLRSQLAPANSAWGRLAPNSTELVSEALFMSAMLMLAILLIPILENIFGLITRARLMELADQERPLLRRLSSEAPGTFEHTLMICSLAEEGARTIGADVDLIRTGGLYHDIGKLHSPNWFIENQTSGINPHDQLNDPFSSADILQAHVDEGLKLARRYRLPRPIADFIPEHQGTLKMGYFLHKAREIYPETSEVRFRYKGPVPRSRETGILMLADGCEAALRALDPKTTDDEAYMTVRKIIESRLKDGQLIESSLSRSEIELVIRAFIKVWRRMRHRRIPYPISIPNPFPA